ncbi:MAG TPA: response regulator [Thermodesulfobacteriota bacterium]|nr:response regulator [Thermodesulfobacteriota bacterium]
MRTILIADEDNTASDSIRRVFTRKMGFRVVSTSSGVDAVLKARNTKPDIVLVDVSLSDKDGYEISREIKSDPGFKNTYVILLANSPADFDALKAVEVCADGHLIKPSNIEEVGGKEELHIGHAKEREISFVEAVLLVALIVVTPVMYELIMSKAAEKGISKIDRTTEKTSANVISEIKEEYVKQPNPATDKSFEFRQMKLKIMQEATSNAAAMSATYPAGKYTVQVGSFKTEKKAKKIMENLASKGYPAFVKTAKNSRKETWHVIRIGAFKTREEAELYGDELKKREPLVEEAIVVSETEKREKESDLWR